VKHFSLKVSKNNFSVQDKVAKKAKRLKMSQSRKINFQLEKNFSVEKKYRNDLYRLKFLRLISQI
jgi:hypothetical protein